MYTRAVTERWRPVHRAAVAVGLLVSALVLLRSSLRIDAVPGVGLGESWGRLFVTAQVQRWISGASPFGHADLLAWPGGQPFWPVDPAVQLMAVPLSVLLGPAAGLTVVTVALVWLAGTGPAWLCRRLGATPLGALAGGLLVQWHPLMLRNLHDLVLEVAAIGVAALAVGAIHAALHDRRRLLAVGAGVLAVAATSPYFAVYLALGCAMAAPLTRRRRAWVGIAAASAVACGLALAPLAAFEGGSGGRLDPQRAGEYRLAPSPLLRAPPPRPPPPRARSPLDVVRRFPGGVTAGAATLAGLAHPVARPWAGLAAGFFVAGPGLTQARRQLTGPGGHSGGLIGAGLSRLPLTKHLGNPGRSMAAFVLLAGVAGGVALRGPLAVGALIAVALEAMVSLPGLELPATDISIDPQIAAAVEGPLIVFPSGDPPVWHPGVRPKEALYLAGRLGAPVAYDYGRGNVPADVGVQVALSQIAGTPIGERAPELAPAAADPSDWGPFTHLLVLTDRLTEAQRSRLDAALEASAVEVARGNRMTVWRAPQEVDQTSRGD